MQLDDTLKITKAYLNSPKAIYTFEGRVEVVQRVIGFMEEGFSLLQDNQPAKPSKEVLDRVGEVVRMFKNTISRKVIDGDLKKFFSAYGLLLKNWNDNTIKSAELNDDINVIVNYVEYHFTTLQLFDQIKLLLDYIKQTKSTSHAPVELSKHFLASLDERIEKLEPGQPVDKPQEVISRRTFKLNKNNELELLAVPGGNCETK